MTTLKEIDERIKDWEALRKRQRIETIKKIKRIYQIKTCTDCKNNETGCLNVFYRELLKQLSGTEAQG